MLTEHAITWLVPGRAAKTVPMDRMADLPLIQREVDISLPPDRRRTAFWCAEKCANSEEQADSGRNGAELTIA